jgi:hypothetical protein
MRRRSATLHQAPELLGALAFASFKASVSAFACPPGRLAKGEPTPGNSIGGGECVQSKPVTIEFAAGLRPSFGASWACFAMVTLLAVVVVPLSAIVGVRAVRTELVLEPMADDVTASNVPLSERGVLVTDQFYAPALVWPDHLEPACSWWMRCSGETPFLGDHGYSVEQLADGTFIGRGTAETGVPFSSRFRMVEHPKKPVDALIAGAVASLVLLVWGAALRALRRSLAAGQPLSEAEVEVSARRTDPRAS